MHRIGRTGRAKEEGKSILFYTEKEAYYKDNIETLMGMQIPELAIPKGVVITQHLTTQEQREKGKNINRNAKTEERENSGFHEKLAKNLKVNDRDRWRKERRKKYSKPKSRGDKGVNLRRK